MGEWYRRLWESDAAAYRAVSMLLLPAEWAYRFVVAARGAAYDAGLFQSASSSIPTLGVGNLTVGGTGKTPITAWFAARLGRLGRNPAVVLRGYGGDEVRVHRLLNPGVPVQVAPDRVSGVERAHEEGADVAVLDDAFQHRRIRADAYVVLVAAEEWAAARPKMLPRGPWREPLSALRRSSLVVTTRKHASVERCEEIAERLAALEPDLPRARAHIALSGLARFDAANRCISEARPLSGFRCALAVAGVANPTAVWAQLAEAGTEVEKQRAFPDHHSYTKADIAFITEHAGRGPVLATLKDAVKLAPALPPATEIYVPIQEIEWEAGEDEVDKLLAGLVQKDA
jgi:tetraacyldisaccharide 4'-kinase